MGLRDTLRNPAVGGGLAASLILIAVVIGVTGMQPEEGPVLTGGWWYDLNNKELFKGPRDGFLPIDAPSGPLKDGPPDLAGKAGVKARVYTCGNCVDGETYIGFIEYYPQSVWQFAKTGSQEDGQKILLAKMVRAVPDGQWINGSTAEGKAFIEKRVFSKCATAKPCEPMK